MKLFSRFTVIGRKGVALGLAILIAAVALLTAGIAHLPAVIPANATKRLLPVYCTDREGKVIARFEPTTDMKEVREAVEAAL